VRGFIALALGLVLAGACVQEPAARAPTAEPSPDPTAEPIGALEPAPDRSTEPVVSLPPPQPAPFVQIVPPQVTLVSGAFAFGALPPAGVATDADLNSVKQSLDGWMTNLGSVLTQYQFLSEKPPDQQANLRMMLDTTIIPGPFSEIVKRWTFDGVTPTRVFTVSDGALLHVYGKSWGRSAYADVRAQLTVSGGKVDWTRELLIRMQVGRSWRILDAFDQPTGRWLVGDAPQYSALAIESEIASNVASYLWNESYAPGASVQYVQRDPSLSPFWKARTDALNELNERFISGKLIDRHFEDVTVRVVRFDPASYLGDGVLTVSVSGRLLEKDGAGTVRQYPFTQQMKFLRAVRVGFVSLSVVDQQSTDGIWDSGGELALYANDAEFG
jgi:hypothetical protein